MVDEADQEVDRVDNDSDSEGGQNSKVSIESEGSDGEYLDLNCEGKPYQVRRKVLTCELHSLLYKIECDRMAEKANEVINSNMGEGHSNLSESKFLFFLQKFRPKDINLHQVHYEFSTNLGLCQSDMTFLVKQKGPLTFGSEIFSQRWSARSGWPGSNYNSRESRTDEEIAKKEDRPCEEAEGDSSSRAVPLLVFHRIFNYSKWRPISD